MKKKKKKSKKKEVRRVGRKKMRIKEEAIVIRLGFTKSNLISFEYLVKYIFPVY